MSNETNKRIAKNTMYLYIRMLVSMLVSLYTSRVVLEVLGIDDFGIYNIIGGIVVLFSFLNNAMSNATQRFLTYEIGRGDTSEQIQRTFSMSVICHVMIALIVLLLAETVGLWFVKTQINLPPDRIQASLYVYHFSIFTFVIGILKVPYNASIISYEKMAFYAYIGIIETILKLVVAYLLLITTFDKLVYYAFLLMLVSIFSMGAFVIYCRIKFSICRFKFFWNKDKFVQLIRFSGWMMLGGGSVIVAQQGGNIIINIFSGVAANAAYGVANQVSLAIYAFVSNFQLAFQPQIVKQYASGCSLDLFKLIIQTSKFSYYLLLLIAVPFIINADFVLKLWLVDVPTYTEPFCILMLVYFLIDASQAPLWMTLGATGKVKQITIWLSVIMILNIPISFLFLYYGASLLSVFEIRVILNVVIAVIRIYYTNQYVYFSYRKYLINVVLIPFMVTILIFVFSLLLKWLLDDTSNVFLIVASTIVSALAIYIVGLSKKEKMYIKSYIKIKSNV